jgi:Flp pilus assembly CpaF family ATPase
MTGFELILPFLRPIEHLILVPEISEVMVNDPEHVFVERAGMMRRYCEYLLAASHLTVVRNIAARLMTL